MIMLLNWAQTTLDKFRTLDFLAPLALRIYLAPVFWLAGTSKLAGFTDTVEWFGNTDWGLGLPFPTLMASLALGTEIIGAVFLAVGLGVRWISIPLMVTMLVAALSVHLENGWQAVADKMSPYPPANIDATIERLSAAKSILKEHGNYEWLTQSGNFIISNNGVEWSVTYLIMLLALFFIGAGKYVSIDYYIRNWFSQQTQ
jgi:uncharacterized membrane protein YphA (DoxX/SURF4 family)